MMLFRWCSPAVSLAASHSLVQSLPLERFKLPSGFATEVVAIVPNAAGMALPPVVASSTT